MISIMSQGGKTQYGLTEYIVDTKEELEQVPKKGQGSLALVIENGIVYILNGSNEWKPLNIKKTEE